MTKLFWLIYQLRYWQASLLVVLVTLFAVLLTYLHNRLCIKDGKVQITAKHSVFQIFLILVLFAGAAAVLWMTVLGRNRGTTQVVYLNPFRLIDHYRQGDDEAFRTLFMNVGVFTPFGAFLGTLFSTFQKHRLRFWQQLLIILVVSAVFSCILETGQYLTACGETDISDLITNTLGGVLGFGIYRLEIASLSRIIRTK